jgi:endonuclease I
MRIIHDRPVRALVAALAMLATGPALAPAGAGAAAPPAARGIAAAASITVAQARATQNGSGGVVRGYVVGQPTASDTVVRSGFPSDYAVALADSAAATDPSAMLFVQVSSGLRAAWGLRSNPGLLGRQIDVTGSLSAYFGQPGLTATTAFANAGPVDPGPTDPGPTDPGTYYADAEGKTGPALASALHTIISSRVTTLNYDQVWDALRVTDEDPATPANVVLLYSGRSQSESSNGGDPDDWNREHVWAKSHGDFGTADGPGTDLHHLRPEDVTVNSIRSNKDFDDGGSPVAEAPGSLTDADSFEPRDAVKGDVARMILYMAVRYDGGDGFADLQVNDEVDNGSAPLLGRLSVLKRWSAGDPPDAFEQRRNQVIFEDYQGNRNPFIDHPEWVSAVYG